MYLGNISGYGTSDFNKALKGTNIAAIEKGLAFQEKQLSKRKPKDTKGIANDMAQIAAAKARLEQLRADPSSKAILTSAPVPVTVAQSAPQVIAANVAAAQTAVSPPSTVPAVVTPPAPVVSTPVTVSPMPQAQPPSPTVAPLPASESLLPSIYQSPSLFTPPPAATPDTAAPVAAPEPSKLPLILGAGALGVLALMFLGKKKRG